MSKINVLTFITIVLSFIVAWYLYPMMPAILASHWGADGSVNSYAPKLWGLFLMPIVVLVLWLFFLLIPVIDPLKANIAGFRKYFDRFIAAIVFFMLYVYGLTIAWNLGYRFNMSQFMAPAFAILFYCIGVLIGHAKQNWFIGIRTPWTLSSEIVWDKTHRVGGKLFKAAGILALGGLLFPGLSFYLIIFPVIAVAAFTLAYSYVVFQKEGNRRN